MTEPMTAPMTVSGFRHLIRPPLMGRVREPTETPRATITSRMGLLNGYFESLVSASACPVREAVNFWNVNSSEGCL